ncbi:MAG: hypothetical protein M4D80_30590 [Myxococcota bacterium]|nr:hypothetical protein [Myxococcota bacterium]
MSRRRELVFVYNAESGLWNGMFDAAHKLVSPSTYACSLCALTYGAVSMKRAWASFVKTLPHAVRFAYRDQLRHEGVQLPALPALLERTPEGWVTLLTKPQIDACSDLDALVKRVREVLA